MATEAFYRLVDRERKVEILWPYNSGSAEIYTFPERTFIGMMGILMMASPHMTQFQFYVESIIDKVLEGYAKYPSPVAAILKDADGA